jgi:hypothetical protein
VARQQGTDWRLDLKPVTLSQTSASTRQTNENVAAPAVEHARDDAALFKSLSSVTAAVQELHRAVDVLGQRLATLEGTVAHQAAASRQVDSTSRALRDSSTASLGRRARRATSGSAGEHEDAAEQ